MSEDSLPEFPPAPERDPAPAKKRATKKAATKKAAKKKAPRTLAEVVAMSQTEPEVEATPVVEAAPAVEVAPVAASPEPIAVEPAAPVKKAKRASTKSKAKAEPEEAPAPVESAPVETPIEAAVPEPVVPAPSAEAPDAAPAEAGAEPSAATTDGEGGAVGDRPQRRLRWWEKRKLERQARAAARGAPAGGGGSGSAPSQSASPAHAPVAHGDQDDVERSSSMTLGPPEPAEGLLELSQKGHAFLRLKDKNWAQLPTDVFVHGEVIRKNGLRDGMYVKGQAQRGHRGLQLTEVTEANGRKPEELRDLPLFEELKAVNPSKRFQLETRADRMTTRVVDMMTPVGRGQRGLIVAPPRAGKTTMLQHIAEAMIQNYPQVHLMILLVDERPEEVTEFKRSLPQAEIFASNNDQDVKSHTRIAQLAIERAKRLVEQGDHVFMLMDSITRLARAFNNMNKNGATMSGGMGVGSMEIPRRLFAAARNTRTAGSLTILATALIETGSRMDDLIFLEFKGTGNMELVLDRKIAEQYIYPAVNIFKSGTRREELLLQPFQIEKIHFLRRGLAGHKPIEAVQRVLSLLERYPNNAQMLTELSSKDK
jgi:transcription termination factor Rho